MLTTVVTFLSKYFSSAKEKRNREKIEINNEGIKVNSEGVFQLIKFNALPGSAPEGGLAISANNFYVGL